MIICIVWPLFHYFLGSFPLLKYSGATATNLIMNIYIKKKIKKKILGQMLTNILSCNVLKNLPNGSLERLIQAPIPPSPTAANA